MTISSNSTDPSQPQRHCLYWAAGREQTCQLAKGGVFIPMPEHVKMHCCNANHTTCRHYLGSDPAMRPNTTSLPVNNGAASRRRYRRAQERLPITIAHWDEIGQTTAMLDDSAYTVDLSLGGIRFECGHQLNPSQSIMFTITKRRLGFGQTGKAHVRWVRPLPESGHYEAGAAFADENTIQSIGRYITIPGS